MTPLQKGCFATQTAEFFEFFSRVFSVNSVAELVFAVESHINQKAGGVLFLCIAVQKSFFQRPDRFPQGSG
jgi:hypothetical protein